MREQKGRGPGDVFEEMLAAGTLTFRAAAKNELDRWGQLLVTGFFEHHSTTSIGWQLGVQKVGTAYCLKITNKDLNSAGLHYLDVYPDSEEFMWCSAGHHDSIHPDKASLILLRYKFPHLIISYIPLK